MNSEIKRQGIHIILFLVAFLLKYLARWQAVALLSGLLFFTLFILPQLKIKTHLYRQLEYRYSAGAVLYFLVLLVLVLIFPLPIVAASWAILALGDGAATLIGKNFKAKELPWNKEKTYAGSIAFIIFGVLGAFILLWWIQPTLGYQMAFFLSLKTVIVAALVESLPLRVNDNITVPLSSALVLYLLMMA